MKHFIKNHKYRFISFACGFCLFLSAFSSIITSLPEVSGGISLFSAGLFVPGGLQTIFSSGGENFSEKISYEVFHKGESSSKPQEETAQMVLGVPTETQKVSEENKGVINEVQYLFSAGGNILSHGGGYIKNSTTHSNEDVLNIISQKPNISLKCDGTIEVLILHTHATECYNPYDSGVFDKTIPSRNSDNENNMVRVGAVLTSELQKLGIGVVHCTTQHDVTFNGAYTREAASVAEYTEKYPDIKIIIDLHRDAIEPDANTRVKPTAIINGKKAAQIMILSGCDNGNMNFPDWAENLRLNALLESHIETSYPGLTKPVFFNYSKYNQNLSTGATLIEIGSHANTLKEAEYTASLIAKPIYEALCELKG